MIKYFTLFSLLIFSQQVFAQELKESKKFVVDSNAVHNAEDLNHEGQKAVFDDPGRGLIKEDMAPPKSENEKILALLLWYYNASGMGIEKQLPKELDTVFLNKAIAHYRAELKQDNEVDADSLIEKVINGLSNGTISAEEKELIKNQTKKKLVEQAKVFEKLDGSLPYQQ